MLLNSYRKKAPRPHTKTNLPALRLRLQPCLTSPPLSPPTTVKPNAVPGLLGFTHVAIARNIRPLLASWQTLTRLSFKTPRQVFPT